jgi:acyl-CoA thioesterase
MLNANLQILDTVRLCSKWFVCGTENQPSQNIFTGQLLAVSLPKRQSLRNLRREMFLLQLRSLELDCAAP